MPNKLINETSPYLLQHANNPVMWYPWGEDAFFRAKAEDKPIFLSIGYSTCHWCHVMEGESFEDEEVARILNKDYIAIKVDKEERPDIDSIYMAVCQAVTGSGGWPLTIMMTPDKKPFYAGTYIPKHRKYEMPGLTDLLPAAAQMWKTDRQNLLAITGNITAAFKESRPEQTTPECKDSTGDAVTWFKRTFDEVYGGFGNPPKFPLPHNLLFLLQYYTITKDKSALEMPVKTLTQMYKGGIFDHIGFGFSRYSTDARWLAPHFEKMLYDNALLLMAYTEGYKITKEPLFSQVADKITKYIARELTHLEGGFYCAQDADGEGIEGKYYLFSPEEALAVLGPEEGRRFNTYFDITEKGNFEGKSIPNLIHNECTGDTMDDYLPQIYNYRKNRMHLHKDDKILVSWNGLMIGALARAYATFETKAYLNAAEQAVLFIRRNIWDGNRLYTSFRAGKHSSHGFIDDYAFFIFGLAELYKVTLDNTYLTLAQGCMDRAIEEFWDEKDGGFFLYGTKSEQFFIRPKETYDGALPSANSVMSYNLYMLWRLTKNNNYHDYLLKLNIYVQSQCNGYAHGHSFFLYALLVQENPPKEITCVLSGEDRKEDIIPYLPKDAIVTILENETKEYPLKNNKTTYYVCEKFVCNPPVNELRLS